MNNRLKILAALGVITVGAGTTSANAAVQYSDQAIAQCVKTTGQSEPECGCAVALEDGSAVALSSFLSQFADDVKNTACAALALAPPDNVRGDSGVEGGIGGDGYGG
jgi:hypothetical protein